MYVSMHELATIHTGKGLFLFGGNVLWIKHPLRDVHRIKNMTDVDIACAGKLLEWALRTNQYWI
ncbi:hypothetical protein M405DRAFT_831314 [Rhizopogon salebrosus TDB-379]|nr:hypothetical protein M405DRAFT_831314 [Rhizopogon salebrosus TDB-379]